MTPANAVKRFLLHEGSTRPAALIRIGLGLLLWARFAPDLAPWNGNVPFHPLLAAAFYLGSTGMILGLASRLSTALAAVATLWMVYGLGPDEVEPWVHHHTTLLAHATALCALTPNGRSYSLDRWLAARRDTLLPERAPTWTLRLIAVQLTVLYLSTALDKARPAFLSGERLQHAFHALYQGADPVTFPGFATLCLVAAWVVFLLEIALPIGLWFRRARVVLIPAGLVLHALFWLLIPVGTFSATTVLLYLAYCDPDGVHRELDRIHGSG